MGQQKTTFADEKKMSTEWHGSHLLILLLAEDKVTTNTQAKCYDNK